MAAEVSAELRARFVAAGQGHVFNFWDQGKVPEEQKASFVEQLSALDLDFVTSSFEAAMAEASGGIAAADLSPPDDCQVVADASPEQIKAWEAAGMQAIARGEVATCVLAGGQGTRLGYDGPKGCYDVGLPSGKPLFQFFSERIRRLTALAREQFGSAAPESRCRVPFLVMTSPATHDTTIGFFKEKSYFGLPEEDVWFFQQGTMPCLTPEGKIMLESAGALATNPDGNGGIYPALQKTGCLAKMQAAGVKYLHVCSVDNVLYRPADPRFVGYCISRGADCGNKCCWKASPEEKVGVMAKRGGQPSVVEYSELDEARKCQVDAAGRLVFGAGNICNHFFSVPFLADVVIPKIARFFHLAHKKIPFAGEDGQTVKPDANNGIKLETFIFDVFPLSRTMAILEAPRAEEFAPVKNPPGSPTDSPDTARAMVSALARRWIAAAGGTVAGDEAALVEVSPLASYAGEGLETLVAGRSFTAPCHVE